MLSQLLTRCNVYGKVLLRHACIVDDIQDSIAKWSLAPRSMHMIWSINKYVVSDCGYTRSRTLRGELVQHPIARGEWHHTVWAWTNYFIILFYFLSLDSERENVHRQNIKRRINLTYETNNWQYIVITTIIARKKTRRRPCLTKLISRAPKLKCNVPPCTGKVVLIHVSGIAVSSAIPFKGFIAKFHSRAW